MRAADRKLYLDKLISKLHQFNMPQIDDVKDPETGEVTLSADLVNASIREHKALPRPPAKKYLWPYVFSDVWDLADLSLSGNYKVYMFKRKNEHFVALYCIRLPRKIKDADGKLTTTGGFTYVHETFQFRVKYSAAGCYTYGDSRKHGDKFTTIKREDLISELARILFEGHESFAETIVGTIETGLFLG